jgi:hypothetical protein
MTRFAHLPINLFDMLLIGIRAISYLCTILKKKAVLSTCLKAISYIKPLKNVMTLYLVNLDVKNTMEEQEKNMSDLTCNEEQNRYGLNLEQEENSSTFSITREQRMEEKSSPANKMFLEGDQIENMREHYEEEGNNCSYNNVGRLIT